MKNANTAGTKRGKRKHDQTIADGEISVEAGATEVTGGDIFGDLPPGLFAEHVIPMLPKYFRFLAPVCRSFRDACTTSYRGKTETHMFGVSSVGQLEIYLEERSAENDRFTFDNKIAKTYVAAGTGQRHIVEWAGVDEYSCEGAARGGRLETLKCLRERACFWDSRTIMCAAKCGHLELLQWAMANGCHWDSQACWYAAVDGKLEVLKWLRANGCPWTKIECEEDARNFGRDHVVAWIEEQDEMSDDDGTIDDIYDDDRGF